MATIIAIGGGEIGRPHEDGGRYPVETIPIDREIIASSRRPRPRLLFIPTASGDSRGYADVVEEHFTRLGCSVEPLYLLGSSPDHAYIKDRVLSSDIIYVGGGNTLKMMTAWRRLGLDSILRQAHAEGIVLSGLSAGALCWFSKGSSDSRRFTSGNDALITVTGLGMIDALACPHYDVEPARPASLEKMMKRTSRLVAIALENCSAIQVVDDTYRIITSSPDARAYRTFWKGHEYHHEPLPSWSYRPLRELLTKP